MDNQNIRKEVSKKNKEIQLLLHKIKDNRTKKKTSLHRLESEHQQQSQKQAENIVSQQVDLEPYKPHPIKGFPEDQQIIRQLAIIKSHLNILNNTQNWKENLIAIKKQITKLKAQNSQNCQVKKRILQLQKQLDLQRHKKIQYDDDIVVLKKTIDDLNALIGIRDKQIQLFSKDKSNPEEIKLIHEELQLIKSSKLQLELQMDTVKRDRQQLKMTNYEYMQKLQFLQKKRNPEYSKDNLNELDKINQQGNENQGKIIQIMKQNQALTIDLHEKEKQLQKMQIELKETKHQNNQLASSIPQNMSSFQNIYKGKLLELQTNLNNKTEKISLKIKKSGESITLLKQKFDILREKNLRYLSVLTEKDLLKSELKESKVIFQQKSRAQEKMKKQVQKMKKDIQKMEQRYNIQVILNQQYKNIIDQKHLESEEKSNSETRLKQIMDKLQNSQKLANEKSQTILKLEQLLRTNIQENKTQVNSLNDTFFRQKQQLISKFEEVIKVKSDQLEAQKSNIKQLQQKIQQFEKAEKTMKKMIQNYNAQIKSKQNQLTQMKKEYQSLEQLKFAHQQLKQKMNLTDEGITEKTGKIQLLSLELQQQKHINSTIIQNNDLKFKAMVEDYEFKTSTQKMRNQKIEGESKQIKSKCLLLEKRVLQLQEKIKKYQQKITLNFDLQVQQNNNILKSQDASQTQTSEQVQNSIESQKQVNEDQLKQKLQIIDSLNKQMDTIRSQKEFFKNQRNKCQETISALQNTIRNMENLLQLSYKELQETRKHTKVQDQIYQAKQENLIFTNNQEKAALQRKIEQFQKRALINSQTIEGDYCRSQVSSEILSELQVKRKQIKQLQETIKVLQDSIQSCSKKYMIIIEQLNGQISQLTQQNNKLIGQLQNHSIVSLD